jgi:16S rRNA (guanine527-N7)-methyltransferase
MIAAPPMTPDSFAAEMHVSRETLARLDAYLVLLRKWQVTVNLVSRSTMRDPWRRHFLDSAQLHPLIAPGTTVVDLGSGAGFPGLVLAMLGGLTVHLVESDQRKAAFLREAARRTDTAVSLHVGRAERLAPCRADVVTARALASVGELIGLALRWLRPGGVCLFPKGRQAEAELAAARRCWQMSVDRIASRTDVEGTILRLGDIAHV